MSPSAPRSAELPPVSPLGRSSRWKPCLPARFPVCSKRLLFCSSSWHDRSPIMKQKVLFICIHNSARSQMAEAFLKEICGGNFEAHSAGLEPGRLNPLAVEALREIGIDISKNQTQSVFDVFKSGDLFGYVITVCDESSA